MMKAIEKDFDCVAMKREIQAAIFEETKDMSHAEEIEYFRNCIRNSPFASFLDRPAAPEVKPNSRM